VIRPPRLLIATALVACTAAAAVAASPVARHPISADSAIRLFKMRPHAPPHRPSQRRPMFDLHYNTKGFKAGSWQPVTASPPFGENGAGTALQMTDGTVFVQDNTNNWYRLTPDQNGNYVSGTWSKAASMSSNYGPLYFASAILDDAKLVVEGGEYNFFTPDETNQGAIYDPVANTWTSISPPSGWNELGDGQSVVFNNGQFMVGNCCYSSQALLNESALSWTATGSGKADPNVEEGWTLLPNDNALTVDVIDAPNTESYNLTTGAWTTAGSTPDSLVAGEEIGPQVLRPDGTVFVAGATGNTAIYNTKTSTWSAGPTFPVVQSQQLDVADGPGTLLPDGNVLVPGSPGIYSSPAYFLEFDGTQFHSVPNTPGASQDSTYNIRLLVLPTGQILETDGSDDVEVYTSPGKPAKGTRPKVTSVSSSLTHGQTYTISGKHLNGLSQANMYGDDVQMATNYPLVRITNNTTGHVFYAKTHNFSSMGVAVKGTVSAMFDVPASIETGPSELQAVADGVASKGVSVTVQ
jgi:hypothetical protein